MLRITYSQTDGEQRWMLCGQLAGPWVQELRSFWQRTQETSPGQRPLVNLNDVTFIDKSGESLLSEMEHAGARFVARGVATRHLIETICGHCERPLGDKPGEKIKAKNGSRRK